MGLIPPIYVRPMPPMLRQSPRPPRHRHAVRTATAGTAVGLTGDNKLVTIDTATATVTTAAELSGVSRIAGIDWRPADKSLYAVTESGEVLRVDLAAGSAKVVATTATMLPIAGPVAMDFNPMADKLRLMSGTTNHRINPDTGETTVDGALHFAPEAQVGEAMPMIVATAYANSFGKPRRRRSTTSTRASAPSSGRPPRTTAC